MAFRALLPLALSLSLVGVALGQSPSPYDELASALIAVKTDEERSALLKSRAELFTSELSLAVGRISERFREEKKYAEALAAAQLAVALAEQLNDRAAQGLAWEHAGRAHAGFRDYQKAAEHFERGIVLFEAIGDKQMASSLLGRQATCYYYLENYTAALKSNLRRLKFKEELNDRLWIAKTLDDIILSHYRLGDFQAALATARRTTPLYEELGDDGGIGRVLMVIGDIQLEQSDYEEAIATYQQAARQFVKISDAIGPALATLNIGQAYTGLGDYGRALDSFDKAMAVFTAEKNLNRMALASHAIGTVHATMADYEQAREFFQRSLVLYDQASRPLGRAEVLNAIGNSYQRQGNYGRALDYLRQGLKLLEEAGRKLGRSDALAEMGDLYLLQGDESLALQFYQQSQTLLEQLGRKEKLAALVGRRGMLQRRRGNDREALSLHEQSLALYEAIGNKHGMAEALITIGESHLSLVQLERALSSYERGLELFQDIGNKNGVAAATAGIARVEQARGDHSTALSAAETAATLAEKTGNLELLWEINSVIGRSRSALNQPESARTAFERSVATIEVLRAQAAGGELARRYFLEHRLAPYNSLIALLIDQGTPEQAFLWAERSKARVLLDVMHSGRTHVGRAMSAAEREQQRKLRAEIISLNTQVSRASQSARTNQDRLAELKSLQGKARLTYEAFQTSLYAAHPELRVQRGEAPIITVDETAALLPDAGGALLEYVVTDEVTYLFAITRAAGNPAVQLQVFTIPVSRAELARQIESFRQQLAGRDLGFRAPARQLHRLLLEPAQALLAGKTDLVLVLDDKLWELPFQALLTESGRYVVEASAVSYAPSLTVLREMKMRRDQRRGGNEAPALLALGNPSGARETVPKPALRAGPLAPLPEAEQEVKALGQLYGSEQSKVYIGAEAREDRVKAEAARAGILHFATHGTLDNAAPMYSHLVLAAGGAHEDGLLEAWELMQMDLQSELAVLSACETARGRYGAGEGMIGLTWALFVAGVPTTLVSQWQVESASTRDLMVSFHRGLRTSRRDRAVHGKKSEALRQAALKLLKNPETSHPFYWAGFVLVGDRR